MKTDRIWLSLIIMLLFYNADVVGSVNSGTLNQEMSFIEIPIEFSYNLLNKKIENQYYNRFQFCHFK